MKRRTFITAVGSIATATTVATAGCLGNGDDTDGTGDPEQNSNDTGTENENETDTGTGNDDDDGGEEITDHGIDTEFVTPDGFDENTASIYDADIEVVTAPDEEYDVETIVEVTLLVQGDECIELSQEAYAFDEDGEVITHTENRAQYEPRTEHRPFFILPHMQADVDKVEIHLEPNGEDPRCG